MLPHRAVGAEGDRLGFNGKVSLADGAALTHDPHSRDVGRLHETEVTACLRRCIQGSGRAWLACDYEPRELTDSPESTGAVPGSCVTPTVVVPEQVPPWPSEAVNETW